MRCTVLGTDGYGRSDTRQNLRRFFEVGRYHIAHAAIAALAADRAMNAKDVARAVKAFGIDVGKPNPLLRRCRTRASAVRERQQLRALLQLQLGGRSAKNGFSRREGQR